MTATYTCTARLRARRVGWIGAVAALALALGVPSIASGSQSSSPQAHWLGLRGAHGSRQPQPAGNLVDKHGAVLAASTTYTIWWGPSSAWASDVQPGMDTFFGGLSGSGLLSIAGQYMRGDSITSSFGGDKFDASAPPSKVSTSTLSAEVQKVYGTSLDPNGVYFVFTSNFPKGGGFCAWHSFVTVGSQNISVAYMPNTAGVSGCDPGTTFGAPGSQGLRSLVNVTSHEFMEAITDPYPSSQTYGWIDSKGAEIGDKCAWNFTGLQTIGGVSWLLQTEWSNAISGCQNG